MNATEVLRIVVTAAATFLLLGSGGMVTSHEAGMFFGEDAKGGEPPSPDPHEGLDGQTDGHRKAVERQRMGPVGQGKFVEQDIARDEDPGEQGPGQSPTAPFPPGR